MDKWMDKIARPCAIGSARARIDKSVTHAPILTGVSLHDETPDGESTTLTTFEEDPEEIAARRHELRALEERVGSLEAEWLDALDRVQAFRQRYLAAVGALLNELANLEADLAEATAQHAPTDTDASASARDARARAYETSADVDGVEDARAQPPPSDELRSLYHDAARLFHPDLTDDADERVRRTSLMSEVNSAYASRDIDALRRLIERAEMSISKRHVPSTKTLDRLLTAIAEAWQRADQLNDSLTMIHASDWWSLKCHVEVAEQRGEDPLATLQVSLERKILTTQRDLVAMTNS